jgi:hypothetical protein
MRLLSSLPFVLAAWCAMPTFAAPAGEDHKILLSAYQSADPNLSVAATVAAQFLSKHGEKPASYFVTFTECQGIEGIVSVGLYFSADASNLNRRGNPSGKSRTLLIDIDEKRVIREAFWQ